MPSKTTKIDKALEIARKMGIARARDFRAAGIAATQISRLCEKGRLVRLGRGLYQIADFKEFHAAHDLAHVAKLVPNGVICLLSALRIHGLTTQLPHAVWLTVDHKARVPRLPSISCEIVRASGAAFASGRRTVEIEGVPVTVYNPAKTVADCFKHRRRVGIDVAIEALRDALRLRKATRTEILRYAQISRVQSLIRPYLEALT